MSYTDEGRAASALWSTWEASQENKLGASSLSRLANEDRRHARALRALRAATGDGNKRVLKRPACP